MGMEYGVQRFEHSVVEQYVVQDIYLMDAIFSSRNNTLAISCLFLPVYRRDSSRQQISTNNRIITQGMLV